jgi:hypothetical protein
MLRTQNFLLDFERVLEKRFSLFIAGLILIQAC